MGNKTYVKRYHIRDRNDMEYYRRGFKIDVNLALIKAGDVFEVTKNRKDLFRAMYTMADEIGSAINEALAKHGESFFEKPFDVVAMARSTRESFADACLRLKVKKYDYVMGNMLLEHIEKGVDGRDEYESWCLVAKDCAGAKDYYAQRLAGKDTADAKRITDARSGDMAGAKWTPSVTWADTVFNLITQFTKDFDVYTLLPNGEGNKYIDACYDAMCVSMRNLLNDSGYNDKEGGGTYESGEEYGIRKIYRGDEGAKVMYPNGAEFVPDGHVDEVIIDKEQFRQRFLSSWYNCNDIRMDSIGVIDPETGREKRKAQPYVQVRQLNYNEEDNPYPYNRVSVAHHLSKKELKEWRAAHPDKEGTPVKGVTNAFLANWNKDWKDENITWTFTDCKIVLDGWPENRTIEGITIKVPLNDAILSASQIEHLHRLVATNQASEARETGGGRNRRPQTGIGQGDFRIEETYNKNSSSYRSRADYRGGYEALRKTFELFKASMYANSDPEAQYAYSQEPEANKAFVEKYKAELARARNADDWTEFFNSNADSFSTYADIEDFSYLIVMTDPQNRSAIYRKINRTLTADMRRKVERNRGSRNGRPDGSGRWILTFHPDDGEIAPFKIDFTNRRLLPNVSTSGARAGQSGYTAGIINYGEDGFATMTLGGYFAEVDGEAEPGSLEVEFKLDEVKIDDKTRKEIVDIINEYFGG